MAERYRRFRQPLAELSTSTNTSHAQRATRIKPANLNSAASSSPAHILPHNLSLEANGSLNARSQANSPEEKRLSKAVNNDDWKRNSAISTTSTNASGRQRKAYIGHWQLGKTIGKGGCSRVRAVRHRFTQQYGAVKIIARSTAESTRAQSLANLVESARGNATISASGYKPIPFGLEREIALMKLLEHDNIVRLYDVWENRNELYLIMEYVDGGELFHYVEQRRGLDEIDTVAIFRQIVAALLYCHRLHICHRDLKPENILLNQANLQVKLIDFGMAALQPEGKKLSTPCGSPHYAAPEVVCAKPYDGKSADAWSCGVILYVMLTGTTPFNYSQDGDIRNLFADITRARYNMPPGLSIEARDLIKRIFVPDPRYRITMDAIWDHPLLHKYDKVLGFDGSIGSKDVAIGPVPKLEDWSIKRAQDIDKDILRNMRTLWHSEPEANLVKRLLDKELNQEKIFYAALLKHQEDNLENFWGENEGVAYSTSDYHHCRPIGARSQQQQQQQPNKAPRSQSQYSIFNDEHLRPSHSFIEPPASVSSYDPYRASRQPIVERKEHLSVTVHRKANSNTSSKLRASMAQSRSIRKSVPKHRALYNLSSSSLPRSQHSVNSLRRSSLSKHSNVSSNWPSSPPVPSTRSIASHKRGVTFNHLRRTSTPRNLTSQATSQEGNGKVSSITHSNTKHDDQAAAIDSPQQVATQAIRSRKQDVIQTPRIKVRKPSNASQVIRTEIRQHSIELEKACEQAFFTSSMGSDLTHSPFTDHSTASDTPASSVSTSASTTPEAPTRKLPEPPGDTQTTYLARTLKEFRAKLAAYKTPGTEPAPNFDEVIRLFDEMLPANSQRADRRLLSVPGDRSADASESMLPSILEESNGDARPTRHRSVTAPVQKNQEQDQTIRIVPPTPTSSVAPLTIRKRTRDDAVSRNLQADAFKGQLDYEDIDMLEAIDEDDVLPTAGPTLKHKKSGWFGMGKKLLSHPAPETDVAHPAKRMSVNVAPDESIPQQDTIMSMASSAMPARQREIKQKAGRRGIVKWIGKHVTKRRSNGDVGGVESSLSENSLFSSTSPSPSLNQPVVSADQGRSWFARFLNIRPMVKLICFSIPRHRTRQELMLLLQEWQRHGIRDLQYSRQTQTITARVDKQNSLDIKPVSFRIELFIVLEHGRRVGLSIARFTQVRGAASGFRKVLEVVDGVMRSRAWLVEDDEKWQAMCDVIER